MTSTECRVIRSGVGWVGLGCYVVGWDIWAKRNGHEPLSQGCWRGLEHPVHRVWIIALTALTVKHLLRNDFLPGIDPITLAGKGLKRLGVM